MQTLVCGRQALPEHLADEIFKDRKRQFVDRLQWELCVSPDGHELDEYDDGFSDYLVVHHQGRHMGSCRVRPVVRSAMITDHFRSSFPGAEDFLNMQKGRIFELTRFCRAPDISIEQSCKMLKNISILLDLYRDEKRLTGFVAVVFPNVARFMERIGMRYIVLSKSFINGQPVLMLCLTHASRASIQQVHQETQPLPISESKRLVA